MPVVMKRVEAVKVMRLASKKTATVELAKTPTLFGEIRQPTSPRYLAIPKVSSERRNYIPIGYLDAKVVCGDQILFVSDANLYTFGILNSNMHNAWMRYTCGRLKSDYRYSAQIVYNDFPWPEIQANSNSPQPPLKVRGGEAKPGGVMSNDKLVAAIEHAAQSVLDARTAHPDSSLADLYDPIAMPPDLRRAHQTLDKAVDAAYGFGRGGSRTALTDAERVAFLFELYHKYTSLLPSPEKPKQHRRSSKKTVS